MKTPRGRLLGRAGSVGTSHRIVLLAVALLFVALGVAVFLVYQNAGIMLEQIRDDFNQQQLILARQAAAQVDADLSDIAVAIESLAHNLPAATKDVSGLRAFYEWGRPKGVLAITVVDSEGRVLAAHHEESIDPEAFGGGRSTCSAGATHPAVLGALLAEAHRTLRDGGLLVLETPNPASAMSFHDVFIRDLTHERPLHPETLRFLAAAAGFTDARVEMRNPVPEEVRLRPLPGSGLPPPVIQVLNENVARLNTLLYAPLDYALIARR